MREKQRNSDTRIKRSLIRAILVCLLAFWSNMTTIHAQDPDEETSTVIAPSGQLSLTFEQLGYDTKGLNRDRSIRYYSVSFPGNLEISPTGNYLDLVSYHLPAVPDKASALKVSINGHLLSSQTLTESNALSNTLRLSLPEGLLHAGYNSIQVVLDTSSTCEDPGSIVDVFIDSSSTISFGYQQNPYSIDLSFYPWPFTEKGLLEIPTIIVLPDSPTAQDLSAAATVAAGLGQMSGGGIDLTTVSPTELTPDMQENNHFIVIGKPESNTLFNELELPLQVNSANIEPGQGVLEEIVSPWNEYRVMLIVSGLDDEGVFKASHALNRHAHFLSVRGNVALIDQLRLLPDEQETDHIPSMTLASLGYEDEIVFGAKPQRYSYDFRLPLGWQLQEEPFFILRFAHADILDPSGSIIDVTLNGIPIASALLDDSNSQEGELQVSLPAHRLKSGRNRLKVGVEMNFLGSDNLEKCSLLADDRAWTVISSESELFLPYNTIDLVPDLGYFPNPFSQSEGLAQTLFVLPDQPQSAILDDLIRLAIYLGSPTITEYLSAHVTYASKVDQETWQDYHLVLLGRPSENLLLERFNSYLPHPFVANSDLLEPLIIDSVAFQPDPGRDAGLLEIAPSPWNKEYTMLAITGTTDRGMQLAVRTLLEKTDKLAGNLAVIEPAVGAGAGELDQVNIYALDTRPPVLEKETNTSTDDTIGDLEKENGLDVAAIEDDQILLAERWWK